MTSNREPAEWLTMMSDTLLAQSAVDRLTSGTHTLIVVEGFSYRQRDLPKRRAALTAEARPAILNGTPGGPMLVATRWSHLAGQRQFA